MSSKGGASSMTYQRNRGQPIQIVQLDAGSRFSLDIHALRRMLLADHVKNLPVAVVSVAGSFRKGKSFLLNFFLRYIQNRAQEDWMDDSHVPLEGFPWRGGSNRETTGILMWNEVFVVTTNQGKKLAVIFLDTQGTFDCDSTVKDGATIFALSLMASSVQIYNLSKHIGEDDLQHLQLFTQYGRTALEETGEKPFQTLIFLVRDWQYEYEWEYGFTGGKGLAEKRLSTVEGQAPELKRLRSDIFSSFEEMLCFLMPHPGKKVTSDATFDGRLSNIDDDFKEHLGVLVSSVLHPNKLVVKKINGCDISCEELFYHLEAYAKIFNEDRLPDPKSMFEAAVEANNSTAVDRAIAHYRDKMKNVFHGDKPYLDRTCLLLEHFRVKRSALELFDSAPKLGGKFRSLQHKMRLLNMISQEFEAFSRYNEGKRIKAEEEEIKEEAQRKAKTVLQRARARVKRIQAATVVASIAMMAASLTPAGPILAAATAIAWGSSLYASGEVFYAFLTQEDSDED